MENKVPEMVRERVSITLPKECLEWLDKKTKSRIYANRSHAIEALILEAMKKGKKVENPTEFQPNIFKSNGENL